MNDYVNSGHGPGYRYQRSVGPRGSLFAIWCVIAVGAALAWLFGL